MTDVRTRPGPNGGCGDRSPAPIIKVMLAEEPSRMSITTLPAPVKPSPAPLDRDIEALLRQWAAIAASSPRRLSADERSRA